ncbi:MAG TPA: right-handed parallel beta-helix repeat-containing protein [Xanthomonadales bacterium]|nr:right-handed parallel beta-helix repeat-containing protein [Xanthomonadales bacterium]
MKRPYKSPPPPKRLLTIGAVTLLFLAIPLSIYISQQRSQLKSRAQVSGGLYVSPSGSDTNSGTSTGAPFKTIQKALDVVQPGTTINLAAGTYLQDAITKRDASSSAPIIITGPAGAIVKGAGASRIFEINHDYYNLSGFTIDGLHGSSGSITGYRDKLIYVMSKVARNGVTGLKITNMAIKNAGGECIRLRYFAAGNEIANNNITTCGVKDFKFSNGGKNGEGIYIGTAPEQWGTNGAPTSDPDVSRDNLIHDNTFDTQGNECVDIKEASTANIIERNTCTGQKDPESGGFDSRGNGNVFRDNTTYGNLGAGIRLGGDTASDGINNDIYGNTIRDNQKGGIKFSRSPQGKICGNTMSNNTGGNSVGTYASQFNPTAACPGGGTPSPSPTRIPTSTPTPTPTPTPTRPPIPTHTITPTSTPVPGNTGISLNLLLHGLGRGGDSANPNGGGNPTPLRPQRNVVVEVFNSQNQQVLTKNGTVNFNSTAGNFTGSIDAGVLATGVYSVKVKSDQFLKTLVPGIQTLTRGGANQLPQATLIAGDSNSDNKLDILDYTIIVDCFSDFAPAANCTNSAKKQSADLTDDGNVNQFDYNLFLRELTNIQGQ